MAPLSRSTAPLSLGSQPVTATLVGPPLVAPRIASQHRYLVLRGLTASAQPGITYSVYIDLPARASPAANDPRLIGTINVFAAPPPASRPASDPDQPTLFFSFDLTATVELLKRQRLLLPQTTVTFIPDGRPDAQAQVVVSRLEIVDQ